MKTQIVSMQIFAATIITVSTFLFPVSGRRRSRQARFCCPQQNRASVSRLPAWNKIVQYAEDQWGKGAKFHLNDPQYPDRIADGCMDAASIPIRYADQPRCSTSNRQIQGSSDGTNQTIAFTQTIGDDSKTSWTVTKESSLAVNAQFKAMFDFPAVAKFEASVSTTGTFRNMRTDTFETTYTSKQDTKFEFVNRDGFECKFEVETTSCATTAMGEAPVIATGTVLAAFDNKRKRKGNGSEGAHYHWFIDFETVLTPEERTSFVEFQGPASLTSSTAYQTNCAKRGESHRASGVRVLAHGAIPEILMVVGHLIRAVSAAPDGRGTHNGLKCVGESAFLQSCPQFDRDIKQRVHVGNLESA
ncbi:hypothetical protein DFP72DRAFT_1052702 [Ephemerocybe angulata]|uniref:Uncharacterized protein n=1 Tax=Ephemerocybe angulata TaxID=980116 RepID=A0A8H6LWF3_9AGAR|nr:hypothetical protein DFP72DRAFT_1052702 [Tulosesus angulatus]